MLGIMDFTMKRSILLAALVFAFLTAFSSGVNCFAEEKNKINRYAMIVGDAAYLYSDASGRYPRFIVDKSYFVFVTDIVGDYARVKYMDGFSDCPNIEGYVKTADLLFYDGNVSSPFPDVTLTAISDAVLFSDAEGTRPKSVVEVGGNARYYGATSDGLYFVYLRGNVGYVTGAAFESFTLPYTYEYIEMITESSSPEVSAISDSSLSKESSSPPISEVILITLAIVAGLVVLYFIIRPDKLGGKRTVFTDDE